MNNNNDNNNLHADNRNNNPTNENNNIGFRVAEAPEPPRGGTKNRPDLRGWFKLTRPCRAQELLDCPAYPSRPCKASTKHGCVGQAKKKARAW